MENQNPLISIVMPTFNREKWIGKAIESVLKQTLNDWELIIIDDGSTDNTESLVESYRQKDDRILFYKNPEPSKGYLGIVRNYAVEFAKGEYFAFLDSDNQYRPDHLRILYEEILKVGADLVYGDRMLIDTTGKKKPMPGIANDFDIVLLGQMNFIDTSDILMKKSAFMEIGGWDESLRRFADWNLTVRLAKGGYFLKRVPLFLTEYYVHDEMNQIQAVKEDVKHARPFEPSTCPIYAVKTMLGQPPQAKIAVFTLVKDRLEYTQRSFESLRRNASYPFFHIIVDNGSTDGTAEWLKEYEEQYPDTFVITNEENVGISKGSNQALNEIERWGSLGRKFDIIIKMDNDCLLQSEGTLKAIVELFSSARNLAVSPRVEGLINNPGGGSRVQMPGVGTMYFDMGDFFVSFAAHIGGLFIAAPAKAYQGFRWNEDDFLHGQQDVEFSKHCVKQKYQLLYMEQYIVEHMDTEIGQMKKFPEYFEKRKEEKTVKYQKGGVING